MKNILVTGANRGIGLEVCKQLDNHNCTVILCSRDLNKGKQAARSVSNRVIVCQLDVTDEESISNAYQFIKEKIGKLDILINNAGVGVFAQENDQKAEAKKFIRKNLKGIYKVAKKVKPYLTNSGLYNNNITTHTIQMKRVKHIMETNFYGPWRMIQYFTPLLERAHKPAIINVSSGLGAKRNLTGQYPGYSISKASLNALTIMLANEFKAKKINVNAVCPGWVKTDMGGPDAPGTVQEGADTIVWLSLLNDIPTGKFFKKRKEIEW